jgi:hypothetical protein
MVSFVVRITEARVIQRRLAEPTGPIDSRLRRQDNRSVSGKDGDALESASMVRLRDILADPAEWNRRFGQWDHVRICGREDFLARMRCAGFETAVFAPFESCPTAAEALHLNPLEVLPMGTKPEDGSR